MRTAMIGLVAAPLLLAPGHVAAATPNWQVTEISGAVSVGAVGRVHPIARGGFLKAGDVVSTGAGARAVLTRGEEYVIVSPASRLRLPEAAASSGGVMQWIEDFGTAVFRIQKKTTPHFGVQTPYLAAVVKGTTFSVTVGATGASVQVVEGAVEVATADGGAAELIRPGVVATVMANDRYRLTINGDMHHVVTSPNAPAAAPRVAPVPIAAVARPQVEVAVAIDDTAPPLESLTGGMVSADAASVQLASATSLIASRQGAVALGGGQPAASPATPETTPSAVTPPAVTSRVVAPPPVAPPEVTPPSAAAPAISPPVAAPPPVTPPSVTPPSVAPPAISPPVAAPPPVTPPSVTPPSVAPPVITPPVVTLPPVTPPEATTPAVIPPVVNTPATTTQALKPPKGDALTDALQGLIDAAKKHKDKGEKGNNGNGNGGKGNGSGG